MDDVGLISGAEFGWPPMRPHKVGCRQIRPLLNLTPEHGHTVSVTEQGVFRR